MKLKNTEGFTLVEVLVAASIFSVAVLGLAMGTVSVVRTNQNTHLNTSAVNLAQSRLEEFRAMTSAAIAALSCPSYETNGCSDSPIASGTTFQRSWQIAAAGGVTQVNVRVNWTDYTDRSLTFTASIPQ